MLPFALLEKLNNDITDAGASKRVVITMVEGQKGGIDESRFTDELSIINTSRNSKHGTDTRYPNTTAKNHKIGISDNAAIRIMLQVVVPVVTSKFANVRSSKLLEVVHCLKGRPTIQASAQVSRRNSWFDQFAESFEVVADSVAQCPIVTDILPILGSPSSNKLDQIFQLAVFPR